MPDGQHRPSLLRKWPGADNPDSTPVLLQKWVDIGDFHTMTGAEVARQRANSFGLGDKPLLYHVDQQAERPCKSPEGQFGY